jgi:hypothetical protein
MQAIALQNNADFTRLDNSWDDCCKRFNLYIFTTMPDAIKRLSNTYAQFNRPENSRNHLPATFFNSSWSK